MVVWADAGVENEPLAEFHRFAKYPGADEKDWDTFSTENGLLCVAESAEEDSRFNADIDVGVLSFPNSTSATSTRFLTCCGPEGSGNSSSTSFCIPSKTSISCELPEFSSILWLLLRMEPDADSEEIEVKFPNPKAAIS